ncbi:AT-rich interactive domain-containing protein 2-like [Culex quinquefasciatus]|uniref:AT-rich interactive domain-containing protein 2-like n=2 Tax=Culex pipiens complex TaxID=518105 RepID=UPI0018E39A32|nr:AT-rich interactive domain-containing protein 2-like [Culex quinquefasciatus]
MRLPKITGRDVDLHRLFSMVVTRGGWLKVNSRKDWDEIIEEMALQKRKRLTTRSGIIEGSQQRYVPEVMRGQCGMSCELYKYPEYDELILSLLTNEQDISINVCMLMANESKQTLKVDSSQTFH